MLKLIRAWLEMFFLAFDKGGPPAPPAVPDPSVQIAAEAKARPSVYSPFGSSVYSGDPSAGTFRQDITLSPEQQALYKGRSDVANALLGRSSEALANTPVGYSFSGATDPATNQFFTAQKALLDPVFSRDEERLSQQLANQGIPMGSEAYDRELQNFRKSKDAAYEQAAADALSRGFSQDIATRQQNLNEVAQALGGSQLTPVGQGSPVDTSGAFAAQQAGLNRQYQGQLAGYNADVAGQNSLMGGLFSLGAAAAPALIAASDRRLKRDIEKIGELVPGVGWYSFRYLWDGQDAPIRYGVMADEVEPFMPEAVLYDESGFAMVDYGRLLAGRRLH